MKQKKIINSIIIILTFLLALFGNKILSAYYEIPLTDNFKKIIYTYSWWIVPTILITGILFGFKNITKETGINQGFFTGFFFALITVSPMLVSSVFLGHINENTPIISLIHKTILAGIMEEYLFRGFLFGILFRKLGWGFIPAALTGGVLFGLGHLYQGFTLIETLGIFTITAIGAIWFSWLYIEWENNLWVPIFIHTFMNLSWVLFEVSDNAMGGIYTNLFRSITIALSIIITIRYHKKEAYA
jgi:hypothetical protein